MNMQTILTLAAFAAASLFAAEPKKTVNPVLDLAPRTPWLTECRELMSLGGTGSGWKATYTKDVVGDFIKMAGDAKVYHHSDEPVAAAAVWEPIDLPQSKWTSSHWKLNVGHYERTFTLTEAQAKRDVRLCFECVGVHYRVFINGQEAVYVPQSSGFLEQHDVSDFVKAGENVIRIQVGGTMGEDNSWIDWPLNSVPQGIIRPFYLEFRDKVAIERVAVRTSLEPAKKIVFVVTVTNMTDATALIDVAADVERVERVEKVEKVKVGARECKTVTLSKLWPEARLWSPADPHLYWATVKAGKDEYKVRFGFRELKWQGTDHRAILNGKPFIMLRTTYGNWTYDSKKNKEQMAFLQKRGLVGVRHFTGENCDLARTADDADEFGWLISTAAASGWGAGFKTEVFWPRWRRFLGKMVDQCLNNPSVICWGLSNEFGTVYGGKDNMPNAVKQGETGEWVQALDPTRPWTCYGEIELRWWGKEGPMPIRSYHYPVSVAGGVLPQTGRWYAEGGHGWQGAFTNDKPVSVSEDLFHGFQDSHPTTAKALVGDKVYTVDGYVNACWYAIRKYCEGYYLGGLAGWDPWCFYVTSKDNPIFDGSKGTPHPHWLMILKEHNRNVLADKATPFTLVVMNRWFAPAKGTLTRTVEVKGEKPVVSVPIRMDIDTGDTKSFPIAFKAPNVDKITPAKMILEWRGDDGFLYNREELDFEIIPELKFEDIDVPAKTAALITLTNSPIAALKFPKGIHLRAKAALDRAPRLIVAHGPLLPQDAQLLDDWVKTGGRVLQLEPGPTDWSLVTLTKDAWGQPYAFSFRRDDDRMKAIPEEAMRTWAPDGIVGRHPFAKPRVDARVLWESVHQSGMQWAEVAWLWRKKGGWLVSTVPALQRLGIEPVAPHFIQSLFGELANEDSRTPVKRTVIVDFGPNPADGTNVATHAADLFAKYEASFDLVQPPNFLSKRDCADKVFVVDAKGTNLTTAAKAFVKDVYDRKGTAVVLDLSKDEDPEWLKFLGIEWEEPLPVVMAPIPWNPSQTNEVDTSRRFLIHNGNSGEIAGLNNEDLFWWKHTEMWCYMRWFFSHTYPTFKWQKMVGEPINAAFESVDKHTRLLTDPGAIGVKNGRGLFSAGGKIVFATFSLTKEGFGGDHPDKVFMTIKTLLNNLGASTSIAADAKKFVYVDLTSLANCSPYAKPGSKAPGIPGDCDYRYFPVNQCGWNIPVQNFCPVEEFPEIPLCYDNVYFKLIDPAKNGDKAILFARDVKNLEYAVKLPQPTKAKRLHFLGWGMWFRDSAELYFGDQAVPCKMTVGDHFGHFSDNWHQVKRGKKIYSGKWDVPPAERGDPEKYKRHTMFIYHWSIDNPEPDKAFDHFTIKNCNGLGIHAITLEE